MVSGHRATSHGAKHRHSVSSIYLLLTTYRLFIKYNLHFVHRKRQTEQQKFEWMKITWSPKREPCDNLPLFICRFSHFLQQFHSPTGISNGIHGVQNRLVIYGWAFARSFSETGASNRLKWVDEWWISKRINFWWWLSHKTQSKIESLSIRSDRSIESSTSQINANHLNKWTLWSEINYSSRWHK